VTRLSLSQHYSESDLWRHYAWAVSPLVKLDHPPTTLQKLAAFFAAASAWAPTLFGALAALGILVALVFVARRRWPRLNYAVAGEVGKASPEYLRARAQRDLKSRASLPSQGVFGLGLSLLIVLGGSTMLGYSFLSYFLLYLLIVAITVLLGRRSQLVAQSA